MNQGQTWFMWDQMKGLDETYKKHVSIQFLTGGDKMIAVKIAERSCFLEIRKTSRAPAA